MTAIDLTPRLAAARRRRKTDRFASCAATAGDMLAAQLRLAVLPSLFGCMLVEAFGLHTEALLRAPGRTPTKPG